MKRTAILILPVLLTLMGACGGSSATQPVKKVNTLKPGAIITKSGHGKCGAFDYELWYDKGDVSMTLGESGTFDCSWNNINNVLFRTGKKFDSTQTHDEIGAIYLDYICDYHPVGNSYLCVYGWSVEPLVEFYVVEAWGSWRPPGSEPKGTIEIDGGMYEIYETIRVEQPSILGDTTFPQYWSVRVDKKTSGTISVSEHFKSWEEKGMKLGKMYEVAMTVEGYQSSGTARILKHALTIGGATMGLNPGDEEKKIESPLTTEE